MTTKTKPATSIMDRVKTEADAYKLFKKMKFTDGDYQIIQKRKKSELTSADWLQIIAEVLRDGQKIDWTDGRYKYWPWFYYNSKLAGFAFSSANYVVGGSGTCVGSRLAFYDEEIAEYFGKQFITRWNKFLTIK